MARAASDASRVGLGSCRPLVGLCGGTGCEWSTLKVQGALFILTMNPRWRIIREGSILVKGQRIVRVGKASEMAEVPAERVIDARQMVVTHSIRGVTFGNP